MKIFINGESAKKKIGAYIRKVKSKWCVYSESGDKFGCYDTKGKAEERLQQMEMFKHINSSKTINLDKGGDSADIKSGDTVILNKVKYVCSDDYGDNYTSELYNPKNGTYYIYEAMTDKLEERDY